MIKLNRGVVMSGKSILFSVLSVIVFIGVIFAIAFLFNFAIIAGIGGIVLIIIPVMLQRKALDEANGIIDKLIAKIIVPVIFVVLALLAIFGLAFWLNLFG